MHRSTILQGFCGLRALLAAVTLCLAAQPTSAATYTATSAAQFQSLLNSSVLGDTIVLKAGTTYTGSFTLPNKTTGTGYLTIQSSALASLPAGRRVFPVNAPNMPRIQAPGSNQRAITTAVSAHHYKLIGLEIVAPADNSTLTAVVDLGTTGPAQDTVAEIPHNIIIDRCIIRANSSTQTVRRGIALNSASTDITNCYIYDFKDAGTDSQAIAGWNGPGPYNIINNYLEAAAEAIIFGGSTPSVPNLVPSDMLISRNHFHKNPAWDGSAWLIKNHFELKAGRRITLDSNVFELSWNGAGGQSGKALTFKCVRGVGQGAPWTEVQDITITNNRIVDCGIGVSFGGNVGPDGRSFNGWPKNFTIRNNLFHNVSSAFGSGYFMLILEGPENITFDHNTAFVTNSICAIEGPVVPGFTFTNNVINHALYGFKGGGVASGRNTFNTWFPNMTWAKNVIQTTSPSVYLPEWAGGWSPTTLGYPSSWTNVLQNQSTPGANFAGYKVVTGSPYDNGGTDGKDVGCDISALNVATAGCISGVWPAPVEVIRDNPSATRVGAWTTATWTGGGAFVGSDFIHDGNSGKGTKTCTWTPNLPVAGTYTVYVRWTSSTDRTSAAPYVVKHAGGVTGTIKRNQRVNGGTWQALGTWTFNAGTTGYVRLSNGGTTGKVIADAVRFVKQ